MSFLIFFRGRTGLRLSCEQAYIFSGKQHSLSHARIHSSFISSQPLSSLKPHFSDYSLHCFSFRPHLQSLILSALSFAQSVSHLFLL